MPSVEGAESQHLNDCETGELSGLNCFAVGRANEAQTKNRASFQITICRSATVPLRLQNVTYFSIDAGGILRGAVN
jgi:hypothetical protein